MSLLSSLGEGSRLGEVMEHVAGQQGTGESDVSQLVAVLESLHQMGVLDVI
jgi:hypothetical protein